MDSSDKEALCGVMGSLPHPDTYISWPSERPASWPSPGVGHVGRRNQDPAVGGLLPGDGAGTSRPEGSCVPGSSFINSWQSVGTHPEA